jgi:protein phosphatase 1 regulatory subunit 7
MSINDKLEDLHLSDSNSEKEFEKGELIDDKIDPQDDEDDKLIIAANKQRQNALNHIEKTYGLTTIPDNNIDILPSDYELTEDIPLDTDYIDLIHLKINSLENLRLQRFENLQYLNLRDNLLTSLNGLKRLNNNVKLNMKELDFYDNRIKHISSHINEFINLINLDLSFNNIKHIKHINNLKKLENLYFVQNKINKIENLENLTLITNLELGGNRIEIIENLNSLINLKQLWLGQNKINKLQGLNMLKNLRVLSIQSNKIEKIEGLDNLISLEELYLSHNKITKIEGLNNLLNLQVLDVTGNKIKILENMESLIQLTDFWCSYNQISSFDNIHSALINCKKIDTVYFEGNPIQLNDPTMYRRKLKLCFGTSLHKIDAMYVS